MKACFWQCLSDGTITTNTTKPVSLSRLALWTLDLAHDECVILIILLPRYIAVRLSSDKLILYKVYNGSGLSSSRYQ